MQDTGGEDTSMARNDTLNLSNNKVTMRKLGYDWPKKKARLRLAEN